MAFTQNSLLMNDGIQKMITSEVDKGLVATFLKMSPEERLRTNDNAVRAILELRREFREQKHDKYRFKRNN